jgi:beta-lactamase regulating signal transducer with metallopeptidase domain
MNDSMQALGWTLVHFCWQAAVIALLYRMLDLAFLRSRSNVRYAFALAAMMGMLLVALGTLGYEEVRIAHKGSTSAAVMSDPTLPALNLVGPRILGVPTTTTIPSVSAAKAGMGRDFVSAVMHVLPMSLVRLMPWIDAMWLAGVVVLSLRTVGGWMLIRRLRMSALVAIPESVRVTFDRLSERMGIRRRIELFGCERISGPLAMGVFRSVVLLPVSALTHLTPDQLEVVLAHELAHIRRGDYLWNMIQTVVETLFFFHPAVWWLGGHLRQQRELCCDDVALACCADPVVYATALLRLEEQRSSRLQLAMALDGHGAGSGLKARIVRILDGAPGDTPERRRELAPLLLVGISAMLGVFFLPLPHVFADHAKPQQLLAATIYPGPRSHVLEGSSDVKCAPKEAFTLLQAPKAAGGKPVAPTPPVAPAHPTPEIAPVVAASPVPAPLPARVALPPPAIAPTVEAIKLIALSPRAIANLSLEVAQMHTAQPFRASMAFSSGQADSEAKGDYINEMRAAGYGDDLDKLVAMKIHGITPEFARSMAQLGFGKPTADELIQLKIFGVTPETISKLREAGVAPATLRDLTSYQIFKVTPEFVAGMKEAGFSSIPANKLVALRVQNVTPEFAKAARQQYPDITVDQLVQLRIFRIDEAFIASAKSHGFNQLTIDKLVRLRISGLLDEGGQKSENK